jgi:predicted metal-dependent hydrolase
LIVAPLKRLCRNHRLDPEMATVLQSFISDEIHHIESFSHLADLAIAADQPAAKSTFRPPRLLRALAGLAQRYPTRLTFWAAVIEGFEQQTLKICQVYHHDKSVDPLFREVLVMHARDEARHCRFDALIARWLQSAAGPAWNALNARLVSAFLASYRSVDWGLDGPLRELAQTHPETADKIPSLLAEAKALRRSTPLPAATE